ncbi:MAG: DUF6263 family protein [Bacteroidales bacterium]|jgi:hypothetical protein|nr:DUF6263 family protein [Bacteroidales bacterium]
MLAQKKHLLLWIIWLFGSWIYAQEKVHFKLNLAKGQSFTVAQTVNTGSSQEINGQTSTTDIIVKETHQYSVLKVTDVEMVLDMQKTDFELSMNRGGGMFSSTVSPQQADDLNPLSPATQMAAMLNRTVTVHLSPEGKVMSVLHIDDMVKAFDKKLKKGASKENRATVLAQFKEMCNEDVFKNYVEQLTDFYPSNPVAIGEQWTVQNGRHTNTCTLQAITDITCVITCEGIYQSDSTSQTEIGGMATYTNGRGTQTAEIIMDKKSGLPVQYVTVGQTAGEMVMVKDGKELLRNPVESSSTTEVTVKLQER